MSVTIGSFTSDALQAQPFSYEGEARTGRTAETIELVGMVKPSEWLAFKGVYDTWRALRLADVDTVVSQVVGSTVSVSATANGITWSGRACWFTTPPSGEQVGSLVRVSATLVDAAQALAILIKEEVTVDCARIKADLEKRKAETDCEISAYNTTTLELDFATQAITLELLNNAAELSAQGTNWSALKLSRELKALAEKALAEDIITFGTFTLGSAVITTTAESETRQQNASFSLTATGNGLISGSRVAVEAREVTGTLTTGTTADVLSWYDSAIAAVATSGAYFPVNPPEFSTESIIVAGAKSTRTNVSISLVRIP